MLDVEFEGGYENSIAGLGPVGELAVINCKILAIERILEGVLFLVKGSINTAYML